MIRYCLAGILILLIRIPSLACTVCGQDQPKIIQKISHGAGPQSEWEYAIIIGGVIVVMFTLIYSSKYLLKPERNTPDHIKNIVLKEGSGLAC